MSTLESNPNAPEVDPQFIIQALLDENKQINENRLYLLALLKQKDAQLNEAQAVWELERESLKKTAEEQE